MNDVYFVSVDGNIGSGKSTLLRYMENNIHQFCLGDKANEYKLVFLQEPVNEWMNVKNKEGDTVLSLFYKDQEKYAFSFQMMAYISRLDLIKRVIKKHKKCIIISERSVHTDKYVFAKMLYDKNLMEEINYCIYNKWFNSFISDIPLNGIVYLDVKPEICKERIVKRSRNGEADVSLDYLKSCDKYHNEYVNEFKTLTLNGDEDNPDYSKVLCQISSYLNDIVS